MAKVYDANYEYEFDGKMIYPKILKCDLEEELVKFGIDCAVEALEKYSVEKDISEYIKKCFDEVYDEFWHVVVGVDFSVSLTHSSRNFLFFQIEKTFFLVFRL